MTEDINPNLLNDPTEEPTEPMQIDQINLPDNKVNVPACVQIFKEINNLGKLHDTKAEDIDSMLSIINQIQNQYIRSILRTYLLHGIGILPISANLMKELPERLQKYLVKNGFELTEKIFPENMPKDLRDFLIQIHKEYPDFGIDFIDDDLYNTHDTIGVMLLILDECRQGNIRVTSSSFMSGISIPLTYRKGRIIRVPRLIICDLKNGNLPIEHTNGLFTVMRAIGLSVEYNEVQTERSSIENGSDPLQFVEA